MIIRKIISNTLKEIFFRITKAYAYNNSRKKILFDRFVLKRNLPINIKQDQVSYFKNELLKSFQPVTILSTSNAYVAVNEGLAIKGMYVLEESLISETMRNWYGMSYFFRLYKNSLKLKPGKYLLAYSHYGGYGHWLADVLPRLFVIKNEIKDYKILLPENYNTFHLKTLAPFGLSEENLVYLKKGASYKISDLTIVSHIGASCNTKDETLQDLRTLFLNFFCGLHWPLPTRKLYISRFRQKNRNVINENEVEALLNQYGFELVFPEDLNFESQVKLFAECKVMIGLTGSGLTNMLFMQKEGAIIEFKMKEDYENLHYFSMSSGMQLDYYYLLCDVKGNDRLTANFHVDCQQLKLILQQFN